MKSELQYQVAQAAKEYADWISARTRTKRSSKRQQRTNTQIIDAEARCKQSGKMLDVTLERKEENNDHADK